MNEGLVVRSVDAPSFAARLDAAVAVYAAAMNAPAAHHGGRRDIMQRHLGNPVFRAHVALRGNTLVGFCYGFHGERGQWWHDAVRRGLAGLPGSDVEKWMADCFEVAELQVLPNHQQRGIGHALITGICAERAEDTVVLSTHDRASPARHLYRSLGFVDLLTNFYFPAGSDAFAIMGASLPLPA